MSKIDKFFRQVFCKHDYEKIGFRQEIDELHNIRYALRNYRCNKCGKSIWVDGRYDTVRGNHNEIQT